MTMIVKFYYFTLLDAIENINLNLLAFKQKMILLPPKMNEREREREKSLFMLLIQEFHTFYMCVIKKFHHFL